MLGWMWGGSTVQRNQDVRWNNTHSGLNWLRRDLLQSILWRIWPLIGNGSVNTFPRRQILGNQSLLGDAYNKRQEWKVFSMWSAPRLFARQLRVTRLYNRGAVFSVLRGPCSDYTRETVWRIVNQRIEYDSENRASLSNSGGVGIA
jgi:hypothetical protein